MLRYMILFINKPDEDNIETKHTFISKYNLERKKELLY